MPIEYPVSNTVLAAVLRIEGYQVHHINIVGRTGTFVFHDIDPTIITEYDTGQILVNPDVFQMIMKQLITQVRMTIGEST
jgi:protein tyrosine phosphatase